MVVKSWLNQRLVIQPIFGRTFTDLAVPIQDDGIIVLYDSMMSYAFCKRKQFEGEIIVGKVHEISYDLACDKPIEAPKMDSNAVLRADIVKQALEKKRTMAATAATSVLPVSSHQPAAAPEVLSGTVPPLPPQTEALSSQSSSSSDDSEVLTGTIVAMTKFERTVANRHGKMDGIANFYLYNKEDDAMMLVLVHQKQLIEFGSLLQEGKGVRIENVDRLNANMHLMPSTLKDYTYYYQANDDTEVHAADSHTTVIDINVIMNHFKLATIADVLNSGYVRGRPMEIRSLYSPSFNVINWHRDVLSFPGLNYSDFEVVQRSQSSSSIRNSKRKSKKTSLEISFAGNAWRSHMKTLDITKPVLFLDMSIYDARGRLQLTSIGSSKIKASVKPKPKPNHDSLV